MEAAGIPGDEEDKEGGTTEKANTLYYKKEKIQAILDMIYTDDGQQQMVKWVQTGEFPQKLEGAGFKSAETYKDKAYRDASLASLFPCSTGTFTSFANHSSRFGHAVLTKYESVKGQLSQWIIDGNGIKDKKYESIVSVSNDALDYKIARIIFILDIFDDPQQIKDVCSIVPEGYQAPSSKSEYTCRPVSAIIANKEGDCVETLYRHLINIAIQDDSNSGILHYSRLPVPLQKYYSKDPSGDDLEIKSMSESGASCVRTHERWKEALKEIAEHEYCFGISSASIINLARTLYYIAFWHEDRTILNLRADTPLEVTAAFIQAAMNKLANTDGRFAVKLVNNVEDSTLPPWVSAVVGIDDTKLKRLIKVGICNKRDANFGHAEIISISKQQ